MWACFALPPKCSLTGFAKFRLKRASVTHREFGMAVLRTIALQARRCLPDTLADGVIEQAVTTYARVCRRDLPETRFAIIMQPRSGSTLLCDLLDHHPAIRCQTDELLRKRFRRPIDFLNGMASYYRTRVWGVKIMLEQILQQESVSDPGRFLRELKEEGFRLFSLTRRNAFLGTLSHICAHKRGGVYHRNEDVPREVFQRVTISDPNLFVQMVGRREKARETLLNITAGLTDLDFCYEDDLLEAESQAHALHTIFNLFGVEPMNVASTFKRISDSSLSNSVTNAEELWEAMEKSPYAGYLSEVVL